MKLTSFFHLISMTLIACLGLSACTNDKKHKEIQSYIAQLKNSAARNTIAPWPPELKLPTPVHYQLDNGQSAANAIAYKKIQTNPLVAYPLKSLKFVGIMTKNNESLAYIMTPDNLIYPAKIGDVIGDDYAKITDITPDHINVSEKFSEPGKQPTERTVVLQIKG